MDAFDYNFVHSLSLFAATSQTGEVLETRELVLTNHKAQVAQFNPAYLKQPAYKLSRALDRTIAYYARAAVPFCLHVRAEADASANLALREEIEARGFTPVATLPGMVLETGLPLACSVPSLSVRVAEDAATLADFQRVAFESFGYPLPAAPLALTALLAQLPHVALFVGYLGERAACCSALIVTGEVAGIYWVGTQAAERGRGLGAAITGYAVAESRARGCTSACLQASAEGAPVYRRMGFREVRSYLRFEHA